METITHNELIEKFKTITGSTTIAIETETIPKMVKKHRETKEANPFNDIGVIKISAKSGKVGCSYSNIVNNQLGREDKELDFQAQTPKWFEYLEGSKILGTNRNHPMETIYISMKVETTNKEATAYTDGTREIPYSELKPYLSGSSSAKTQDALEKKVIWNNVKITSIKVIKMFGKEYFVCSESERMEMEKIKVVEAKRIKTEANEANIKMIRELNADSIKQIMEVFRATI